MRATILLLSALGLALPAPSAAQDTSADTLLTCGYLCSEDGTPLMTTTDEPPTNELVTKIFLGAFSETCSWAIGGGPGMYEPETFDFTFRQAWTEAGEPDEQLRLYRFFCGSGAYNLRHVYLTWTADAGVQPVLFPTPTYAVEYADGDDIDSALVGITLTGIGARHELVNSRLDEATRTITEWSCWRGLCDASGSGTWVLDGDRFRLVTYDIDPTYDGEVNQFRLVDFREPRPVDLSAPITVEPPLLEGEEG